MALAALGVAACNEVRRSELGPEGQAYTQKALVDEAFLEGVFAMDNGEPVSGMDPFARR
jgi:hypothetical protein